ncbi:TPA: 2,3-butanediol dehydrogenase [Streptococcus pneumoniae]
MATMKAARWHAAKDVRIQEIEVPEVLPHQVKVAVKFTGICGTDLHEFLDGPIFIPTDEHVYSGQKAPVTLGHEFSGEIIEVGSDVTRVKVGDRVAVEPILAKNNLVGDYNLDPNLNFVGLAADGGFAKYCVLDGDLVHVIPDSLSYEQAALTEPAAVAVYAVRQSSLKAGDTAVEAIHRLTNGGVDVSYEVTGVPVVLGQALAAVHKAGECMVVSIWEREANINPNEFAIQEKTLKGIIAYRHIFPKVLELMEQGYFSAEKLVTKKIKLENIVEEGFIELTQDKSQIKILVEPE